MALGPTEQVGVCIGREVSDGEHQRQFTLVADLDVATALQEKRHQRPQLSEEVPSHAVEVKCGSRGVTSQTILLPSPVGHPVGHPSRDSKGL